MEAASSRLCYYHQLTFATEGSTFLALVTSLDECESADLGYQGMTFKPHKLAPTMRVFGGKGYLITPPPPQPPATSLLAHSLLRGPDLSLDERVQSRGPLKSCILKEESGEIW